MRSQKTEQKHICYSADLKKKYFLHLGISHPSTLLPTSTSPPIAVFSNPGTSPLSRNRPSSKDEMKAILPAQQWPRMLNPPLPGTNNCLLVISEICTTFGHSKYKKISPKESTLNEKIGYHNSYLLHFRVQVVEFTAWKKRWMDLHLSFITFKVPCSQASL